MKTPNIPRFVLPPGGVDFSKANDKTVGAESGSHVQLVTSDIPAWCALFLLRRHFEDMACNPLFAVTPDKVAFRKMIINCDGYAYEHETGEIRLFYPIPHPTSPLAASESLD